MVIRAIFYHSWGVSFSSSSAHSGEAIGNAFRWKTKWKVKCTQCRAPLWPSCSFYNSLSSNSSEYCWWQQICRVGIASQHVRDFLPMRGTSYLLPADSLMREKDSQPVCHLKQWEAFLYTSAQMNSANQHFFLRDSSFLNNKGIHELHFHSWNVTNALLINWTHHTHFSIEGG